jgi:hypothetical protein
MGFLRKLPGFQRSPAGLEWRLFRRLPAILAWGTALPLLGVLALWWSSSTDPLAPEDPALMLWMYQLLGLVILHWTLVLTVAIGCGIVLLMKGPAYAADTYPHLP